MQRIYQMTLEGSGWRKLPPPSVREGIVNPTYYGGAGRQPLRQQKHRRAHLKWNHTVKKILTLQEYCGDVISNPKTYPSPTR